MNDKSPDETVRQKKALGAVAVQPKGSTK